MLHGAPVTLHGVRRDDLERRWQFNNDVRVELAGGGDPPVPQLLDRLRAEFDREAAAGGRDGADFAIEVDGLVVGRCGLIGIDATHRTAMLGIGSGNSAYWGQGDGREAVRLLLDYAFRRRNLRRVRLWAHADNERAIGAYRAAGFVEEGRRREHVWSNGRYVDAVQMGVLRDEWPHA